MRVLCVVGARPNFMKVAPVVEALRAAGHEAPLVHTGQHYDAKLSEVFFEQLGMPAPDENLGVGSGSHATQTAGVMVAFEPVLERLAPDAVLVAGDVNSTLACGLVASKRHRFVAHLEAGLRSRDRRMPEETNRILTDHLSDLLLTPSPDADANLLAEGLPAARIARVGNLMIDSLRAHLEGARAAAPWDRLGVEPKAYALATLHRAENVDDPATLARLVGALCDLAAALPVLLPLHPRTQARLGEAGAARLKAAGVQVLAPLGYLEFLALTEGARLVLTDSGGIQEETTALGVPCLTLRENTERPITLSEGTNRLVGTDPAQIAAAAQDALEGRWAQGKIPALWDGQSAGRVVEALARALER